MNRTSGLVLKCVGGLYHVLTDDGQTVSCYARGIFRKDHFSPTAGDRVILEYEGNSFVLAEVLPRKNCLVRPFCANINRVLLVFSVKEPSFNPMLLDKMLAILEYQGIESVILLTKNDLMAADEYETVYRAIGYKTVSLCAKEKNDKQRAGELLTEGVNLLCGNSGVGKTTLLNLLLDTNELTAEISQRLGRGRHTTRQAQLYRYENGKGQNIFIADTPGFASLDIEAMRIDMDEYTLPDCFIEFKRIMPECRFDDCKHIKEPGCAVLEAVRGGAIAKSRYESYLALSAEIKNIKKY